ncbi:MAG TPA: CHAP domain-containing protein [Chthonomonadaceae bacterium]|nr:CHAP domain-containing protein [Chthonomonadaceae bacterium]
MTAITVSETASRATARTALEIALGYAAARIREEGGNNRGDQVEFFQRLMGGAPGDPWCADFVCACLVKAYARLHGLGEDRERLPQYVPAVRAAILPLSGRCYALAMAARSRRMLRDAEFEPLPGDLVLFDFRRLGEPHHVGFVESVQADGGLMTVEGNTVPGPGVDQADGDGVYRRARGREGVSGFVHFA